MKLAIYYVVALVLLQFSLMAQTAVKTSFEAPTYITGNVNSQNLWAVASGNASISNAKSKTGSSALSFNNSNSALAVNFIPYSGTVTGIRDIFYTDMWINPVAFATKGIYLTAYDQYGGSLKRIYIVEFTVDNKIKVSNGGTQVEVGTWTTNQWTRISIRTDLTAEKFKIAINGVLNVADFSMREAYVPTASAGRAATYKEFHSFRINHTTDTQLASSDFTIDDLYIGKNPIPVAKTIGAIKTAIDFEIIGFPTKKTIEITKI